MAKTKQTIDTLFEGRFIRLVKNGRWEYAQRTNTCGIVMIVPITSEGELLMIQQVRPAIGKTVIELPAGLAGDGADQKGEPLVNAAKRELLEETGYVAAKWKQLTEGPPSAGLSDEVITIFLATGLKKVGTGEGDGHEEITTHRIKLSRVEAWLRKQEKEGKMIDLKLWGGLHFARAFSPR